jgi:hypothetical protein
LAIIRMGEVEEEGIAISMDPKAGVADMLVTL